MVSFVMLLDLGSAAVKRWFARGQEIGRGSMHASSTPWAKGTCTVDALLREGHLKGS